MAVKAVTVVSVTVVIVGMLILLLGCYDCFVVAAGLVLVFLRLVMFMYFGCARSFSCCCFVVVVAGIIAAFVTVVRLWLLLLWNRCDCS